MRSEVGTVPPSRLLYLLKQALKYQESQGIIFPNIKLNILTGFIPPQEDDHDRLVSRIDKKMQYGAQSRIETLCFSHNGSYLATGSVDGIIEIYDPVLCKIKTDLSYQADENFMVHEHPVMALCFNSEDELLVSGDKLGVIKIWRVETGKLLKKIEGVMDKCINKIIFGSDPSHIIIAGLQIKLIGLKSGKSLKEFSGHTSYINDMVLLADINQLVSAGAEGKVKIFDYKTGECTKSFEPPVDIKGLEIDVNNVISLGKNKAQDETLLICNKSQNMIVIDQNINVLKAFPNDKTYTFVSAAVSAHKQLVYGATQNGYIFCYLMTTGKLTHFYNLTEDEIVKIEHHPLRNIMAAITINGDLIFVKP